MRPVLTGMRRGGSGGALMADLALWRQTPHPNPPPPHTFAKGGRGLFEGEGKLSGLICFVRLLGKRKKERDCIKNPLPLDGGGMGWG